LKTHTQVNEQFAAQLKALGLALPKILMPKKDIDLKTWAIVACDQYTSDHAYWNEVYSQCQNKASTLHITLPEIFLEAPDVDERIAKIHATMENYLKDGTLAELEPGITYLERDTELSGKRQGLLFAMDLEAYNYARDSQSLIRATEGTIVERIPPRLRVRSKAKLETPHIMILIDDPEQEIIEPLAKNKQALKALYSVELMQKGGTLAAWQLQEETLINDLLSKLETLLKKTKEKQNTDKPLFFAMGDGNHSLATAKAHWEHTKERMQAAGKSKEEIFSHPARYALAEIVNVHSPGLRFEPIHRAVFCEAPEKFRLFIQNSNLVDSCTVIEETELQKILKAPEGQNKAGLWDGQNYYLVQFNASVKLLPPAAIDTLFSQYKETKPKTKIDFIHGWKDVCQLSKESALACLLPVISRERLFGYVQENGPLPRKAFSMGDAEEKKYYLECRAIQ